MTNKLLEHFKRMQECAARYILPNDNTYTDRDGKSDTGLYKNGGGQQSRRDWLFANDMIYMLDGPEQREAEASVGNPYIADALRTESGRFPLDERKYPEGSTDRLLHAAMGLTTESGEFLDALKKHLFYGKPLDTVNLVEEASDIFWYLAIVCDALGITFEEVQALNIAKLRARYPEKFDSDKAINRDLDTERAILEGNAGDESWVKDRF